MPFYLTPVFGLQGTGRWDVPEERPTSWRQVLLQRYPRGELPITALMSKTGRESVSDPMFHWWEQDAARFVGRISGVYTDEALTSPLSVHNSPVGTILFLKVNATEEEPITNYTIPGSLIHLTATDNSRVSVTAEILEVDRGGGANSKIKVRLRTPDSGNAAYSLTSCNWALVLPTVFPEFGGVPEVISYKPGHLFNYCTILKEAIALSRTALKTKDIRPESDVYNKMKRDALYGLGVKMERQLLYGVRFEEVDPVTNQIKRGSMGLMQMLQLYGHSDAVKSFKYDPDHAGRTWKESGYEFLRDFFRVHSQYVDIESCWHIVGNGVLMALSDLAEHNRMITMTQADAEYGLNVKRLITPWGTLNLLTHPLFNQNPSEQYTWIGIPREGLVYRYVDDITFLEDQSYGKGGIRHIDGRFDLWLVECGYEYHNTKGFFALKDVGLDNVV